jgi:hypothetical protein
MLAKKVVSGAVWLVGARFTTKLLDLLSMMIVADSCIGRFWAFRACGEVVLILSAITYLSLSEAIVQMSDL